MATGVCDAGLGTWERKLSPKRRLKIHPGLCKAYILRRSEEVAFQGSQAWLYRIRGDISTGHGILLNPAETMNAVEELVGIHRHQVAPGSGWIAVKLDMIPISY
jgi:hypothetical protein